MKKTILIFMGMLTLIIQSCSKDNFDFETDKISKKINQKSSWALPIVNSSVKFKQLINKNKDAKKYLEADKNGFLTLTFEDTFGEIKASTFFKSKNSSLYGNKNTIQLPILAPLTFNMPEKIFELKFNELENIKGFYCADPQINISIKNYWSVPVELQISKGHYYKQQGAAPLAITGTLMSEWHSVNIPEADKDFAITNILMNKDNSNLPDVISELPHSVSFFVKIKTKDEAIGKTYDIDINSEDSIKLNVKVPMEFKMQDVLMQDTIKFDLGSEIEDKDLLKSIKLNMQFNNDFPINAKAELFLADKLNNIIEKLTDTPLTLKAGKSVDGKANPVLNKEELIVEGLKKDKLLQARNLIIKINLSTNNEIVKLYEQYAIGIKISALVKLDYEN